MKFLMFAALAFGVACAPRDTANTANDSAAAAGGKVPAPPATDTSPRPEPGPNPPPPSPAPAGSWTVTPFGIGPVRAGMTLAEAGAALGESLTVQRSENDCGYAQSSTAPAGVAFMVVRDRIARAEVRRGTTATAEGARIGDTEAKIDSLYRGRVTLQPHKYTNGHYLVVDSGVASDTTHRIIFETDGKVVTRYHSGRMPEVAWVESCS